jgi:hypothetical protein
MTSGTRLLAGLKVVEFTHMVMGPTAGLVLADLGADVVKVEPIGGDKTRRLGGSGAGYFPMYNRNKQSLSICTRQGYRAAPDRRGGCLHRKLPARRARGHGVRIRRPFSAQLPPDLLF